ncbi:hypothetical protein SAMN04487937_1879 [Halorubrum sodomense]|uniref:Uncharacterized protein n=1 Tax=Halorubrum sodomense TaxID=35743 RepID=A0A1I6GD24_HALSD|nr:hypothetical protein SAMN04487937_1879 [Halorubrum sodomense]
MDPMDRLRAIKRVLRDRDVDLDRMRRESKSDWESGRDDDRL